ncbi:MAG: hypothetical protein NT139_01390, partial [Candidatus Woesearchaeota archaeon]|nr:hypothetical protein [Candidatus Woesearchaeota archaeon]
KTQAVARGLENVYPITTMVDDKRTQWADAQFDTYKKIIDDEIETIKQASKKYKGIKFGAEMPFGKGAISNMKDSAPKIWNYLNTKLAEIGIDNTGDIPTVIDQSVTQSNITFDELTEFTDERKQEIIINFAAKHKMSEEEAENYINESLAKDKENTINKLKECY